MSAFSLVTNSCAVCRCPVRSGEGFLVNSLVIGGVHHGACQTELTRRFELALRGPVIAVPMPKSRWVPLGQRSLTL